MLQNPSVASAAGKCSSARGGGVSSDGTRGCAALVLLAAGTLLIVGLQWESSSSSLIVPLQTTESRQPPQWAPGHRAALRGDQAAAQPQGMLLAEGEQLLSFEVCGDPAMQRLALLSGKHLIKLLGMLGASGFRTQME